MKYNIFVRSQTKTLLHSVLSNLSVVKLLKRLTESFKERKPVPIEAIASEASESEIEVLYLEALLEYNNVFKEAHPDRSVEEVKAEAKKASLETFIKSSKSKQGNPAAYNRYLNQLFENFKQKENIIKGQSGQGKLQ